jgi:hypothetical protein
MRAIPRTVWTALIAAMVLAAPSPAFASRSMEIGLQDDAVFVDQAGIGRETGFARAKEIGVTTIRANMLWSRVMTEAQANQIKHPKNPQYDFSKFDALVDGARAHGFRVQLTITGPAPAWATKSRELGTRNPNVKDFTRFTTLVAKHFKGKIDRYSIWNEPNWYTWLSPAKTGAAQYRALYTAGYTAIKKTDRKAKVIFGELAPRERQGASVAPLTFIKSVLCVDKRFKKKKGCPIVRTDGVSVHPYDYSHAPNSHAIPAGDVSVGTVSRLTSALGKLRKAKALATPANKQPPVHLTEFAYFASGPLALPRDTRARYITQAFSEARANPQIAQILYFGLVQNPFRQWDTGLLMPDGTPDTTFTALKSWVSQQRAAGKLTSG